MSDDGLLEATERVLRRSGLRRCTMTEIASEAGISRAWLYRQYPDKASLVVAALVATDEAFWAAAHARVSSVRGIGAQVAEAVSWSRAHRPRALLLELRASEPEAFAEIVGNGLRQMLPGMAQFWHPYLRKACEQGEVRADLDIGRCAEWVMRVVLSLVTVPGEEVEVDDPGQVRRFVEEFLVPGLR